MQVGLPLCIVNVIELVFAADRNFKNHRGACDCSTVNDKVDVMVHNAHERRQIADLFGNSWQSN